jgi:hypothetical protein
MEQKELQEILSKHLKWIQGNGGKYANLYGADLRNANLYGADLRNADLRNADLCNANLYDADLRGADLRNADLRSANLTKTILENINWLSYIGIVPDAKGYAYAYKMSQKDSNSCQYPTDEINYDTQETFTAELDRDVFAHCSSGINLATFAWCLNNKEDNYRLFLMKFRVDKDNVCVPVATDGKFRVAKCTKVGECDWNGNLLKEILNDTK